MVKNYFKRLINKINEYSLYGNFRQKIVSKYNFKKNIIVAKEYSPVFFLSTGRAGTEFFTNLLEQSKSTKVFHSPSSLLCNSQSELTEQGKVAYELYRELGFDNILLNKCLSQLIMGSREELLYITYLHDKIFIETNNRITFLAPALKYTFPNVKFVHLYRHPGEFVRSGIRRNYYKSIGGHELGRLTPIKNNKNIDWENMHQIEKVSWLWSETNNYIDDFFDTLNLGDYYKININELTTLNIKSLLEFLNISDISNDKISSLIDKPRNIQKNGNFPIYSDWTVESKDQLKKYCQITSDKYGYKL